MPDIKLQEKEKAINREPLNVGKEDTTLCELSTDEKTDEESINRLGDKGPLGPMVKWIVTGKCVIPSENSEKSLIHLGEKCEIFMSHRGKGGHMEMNTENSKILSENGEKSPFRCSTVKGNLHHTNCALCVQSEY